jgi:TfoX/Sxy family transcriptional regulator of competence genes
MAPSEELAQRISDALAGRDGVSEGTTFGCVTWMVHGNVACGVAGDKLLVRVGRCDLERIVVQAHVQPMKRGARTMRGFVTIDSDAITDDAQLARWIDAATAYAACCRRS